MGNPCPEFWSFDPVYYGDFRCAQVWEGIGNVDGDLACNPECMSSGYDEGDMLKDGNWNDMGDHDEAR